MVHFTVYLCFFSMFFIGLIGLLITKNLFSKIVLLNLVQFSTVLIFISAGFVFNSQIPIISKAVLGQTFSNPLVSVLMLTAIVVGLSVTCLGYSIIILIKKNFGTIDTSLIEKNIK